MREALFAWLPYIVLILVVVGWTNPWSPLPSISLFKWIVSAKSSVTHSAPFPHRRSTSLRSVAEHRRLHLGS